MAKGRKNDRVDRQFSEREKNVWCTERQPEVMGSRERGRKAEKKEGGEARLRGREVEAERKGGAGVDSKRQSCREGKVRMSSGTR